MTTEKKVIACLGSGEGKPGDPMYDAMQEVGRLLAERGHTVATGGFGGIGMEAPCRGARSVGGHTIGYTFDGRPANEFVVERIECSWNVRDERLSDGTMDPVIKPLAIELQYGFRLGNLLTADAFIIASTGDLGTLVELLAILNLSVKVWKEPKRVAMFSIGRSLAAPLDRTIFDHLALQQRDIVPMNAIRCFHFVCSPEEAVAWATGGTLLP